MIYNSAIESIRDQEFTLEGVQDRFQHETILEAGAVLLAESERNWTKFMEQCGLMESSCIQEGVAPEMIYEGGRLRGFIDKAIGFFKLLINKIKEITTAFINKVAGLITTNAKFIKMYGSKLKGASISDDFEYEGYTFKGLKEHESPNFSIPNTDFAGSEASNGFKGERTRDKAAEDLGNKNGLTKATSEDFVEKLDEYLRGSDSKVTLTKSNIKVSDQVTIIEKTKELKDKAGKSYKNAVTEINKIIKKLEGMKKEADSKKDDEKAKSVSENASTLIQYWKDYGNFCLTLHTHHMTALKQRNSQARSICVKVLNEMNKKKAADNKKDIKNRYNMEGYVETDAFLGAVDFI